MLTPLKAIRAKCVDCSCGNMAEVKRCPLESCPLHPYRFGKNPSRAGIGNRGATPPVATLPPTQHGTRTANPTPEGKDTTTDKPTESA